MDSVSYVNVRIARSPLRSRAVDVREEQVVLETDRHRIEGRLTLPREGYRSRLSDYVNQREREFLTISDATVAELEAPERTRRAEFVLVGRAHVRLIGLAGEGSLAGGSASG